MSRSAKSKWSDDLRRSPQGRQYRDVILLPVGTSPFSAQAGDFKRVTVQADDDLSARMALAVVKLGMDVVAVLPMGAPCREEQAARARAEEQVDKINIKPMRVPSSYEA